jgi:hypothetical protein
MSPCGNCTATEGDICEECTMLYFAFPWMLMLYNFDMRKLARLFKDCGQIEHSISMYEPSISMNLLHYRIFWDYWVYQLIEKYHKYLMREGIETPIQLESEDEDEESGIEGSWWDSNGGYPCGYTNPLGYGDGS